MRLKRWGANRNSGWTAVIPNKDASAAWSEKDNCIQLSIRRVDDPYGNGQYNYKLELTIEEFAKVADALAKDALKDQNSAIGEKLASSSRSLLRLLLASGGFPLHVPSGSPKE